MILCILCKNFLDKTLFGSGSSGLGYHHEIHFIWRPYLRDPNDELVLEIAVTAQCEHIVTYNVRDFAGVEEFGIKVLTPKEFLQEIGEIS